MKICVYGNFGTFNSGNESTLVAVLWRLRRLFPDCELWCVCSYPDAVAARDGIDAVPITTRATRIWPREDPVGKRLRIVVIGMIAELGQWLRAFRTLKGTDMVIIPGTGLLTDAYGLAGWGPYNMFKWSLMAKLRGCKLIFLSVGAGPIYGAVGRTLVKSTLALADYRSYRDAPSMQYLRDIGFRTKHDSVYPDLVFGLPEELVAPYRESHDRRRVVGLGLMLYAGTYSVANPTDETYTAYLEALAVFVRRLLDRDYEVRLLLGDDDTLVIQEFRTLLRARLGPDDEARVIDEPITSIPQVLAQLAASDIVVATRFHNVLLALLLNKPVIAISFHHKCSALMKEMGLSEYVHDINHMDAEKLMNQFAELEAKSEAVRVAIRQAVEESRKKLDEQYEALFASG